MAFRLAVTITISHIGAFRNFTSRQYHINNTRHFTPYATSISLYFIFFFNFNNFPFNAISVQTKCDQVDYTVSNPEELLLPSRPGFRVFYSVVKLPSKAPERSSCYMYADLSAYSHKLSKDFATLEDLRSHPLCI